MSDAWVVDASVAAKWVLPEADSEAAARVSGARLVAPELLDIECASILWKAARRGEIGRDEALLRYETLRDAPVERMPNAALLPLAVAHALELAHPVYGCLYIAAAELTGFPLITADARLRRLHVPRVRIVGLDDLS
ncbi:type II toxin-antitoxin system VapC family toxin [Falsiroseomonas oryziterrae]|uniref:type II toxin-antitoxin system VapC family toxin n=1 Tax=Falsiroseomonas oryziterrae TaxID=2911368 RepID=UPI001F31B38A|nr:type II toxin-antitoxin system VapC family toxin [Roseomonas sp. NPKOSM-4]